MSDILTAEGYEQTKEKLRPGNPCHESEPGHAAGRNRTAPPPTYSPPRSPLLVALVLQIAKKPLERAAARSGLSTVRLFAPCSVRPERKKTLRRRGNGR
jgi:hypothetical protein